MPPGAPTPTPPAAEDAEFVRALRASTAEQRADLVAALRALRAVSDPLVTWSDTRGNGGAEDPLILPYPSYDPAVWNLLRALVEANAAPVFAWMDWEDAARYRDGVSLRAAPVTDAMRMVTRISRGERFGDGVIAVALEDGTLLAAADRIAAWLHDDTWSKPE